MKIEINDKTYKYHVGMAFMEALGKEINSDEVSTILGSLEELEKGIRQEKVNLKAIKKLSKFIQTAIETAGGKIQEDVLAEWVYSNPATAVGVYFEFIGSLPGNGDSDQELLGKAKASQGEAA